MHLERSVKTHFAESFRMQICLMWRRLRACWWLENSITFKVMISTAGAPAGDAWLKSIVNCWGYRSFARTDETWVHSNLEVWLGWWIFCEKERDARACEFSLLAWYPRRARPRPRHARRFLTVKSCLFFFGVRWSNLWVTRISFGISVQATKEVAW